MVNLWSTLGFVVESITADAPKDLYETEFDTAPAAVLVAAVTRRPAAGKRTRKTKTSKSRARSA